jgi:hypothetical protein
MISRFAARRALALACCLLTAAASHAADLTPEAWKQDLDVLARELPQRHINLFFQLKRADWDAQVERLAAALPGMSGDEVRVALKRLVASVGNAHTGVSVFPDSPIFPIRFGPFAEGLFVVAAKTEQAQAIGARLAGIGAYDIGAVIQRLSSLIPRENALVTQANLPALVQTAGVLRGTGIAPATGPAVFHFEKNGRQFTLEVAAVPPNQQGPLTARPEGATYEIPLYLSDRETLYWFRYLGEPRALYIQYNSCQEMKTLSFAGFTKQAMEAADQHKVDKVIVDLRHNGGGNSEVIRPLLVALDKRPQLRRKGHLFVLTSIATFSSGLLNTLTLQRRFHAVVAGQTSSQSLNSYGDIRSFKLPNSGLDVWYCTKYFKLAPGKELLEPDLPVPLTAADYFAGRDAVLEAVLRR